MTYPPGLFARLFFEGTIAEAVWSTKGRLIVANGAFADLFGGTPGPDYVLLEDAASYALVAFFARAQEGETVAVPPLWLPRFDGAGGDRVAVSTTLVPLRDEAGTVESIAATYLPRSEASLPPASVRRSPVASEHVAGTGEAQSAGDVRFRRLAESGLVGVVVSDLSGHIVDANDAFLAMVGYTRADLEAGRVTGAALNTPERLQTDAEALKLIATLGRATWEKQLVRKDGTRVPVVNAVVRFESDTTTTEILCVVLDVTDQKRAQSAARESEARRAAVMAAALDAVVLMDGEGRIIDFNPAAEQTFGYAKHELLGRSLAEHLLPPAWRVEHQTLMPASGETGSAGVAGKRSLLTAMRKDGSEFPAEVAVAAVRTEAGPVFVGHVRDITERLRAAEAEMLRRERDAAAAANADLEAFSYSAAHDLRAPLRAIHAFSTMLNEDHRARLSEEGRGLLDRISANALRMGGLIDSLLTLAKLSKTEVSWKAVDLSELAREVQRELVASAPSRQARFVVAEPLLVRGDPALLRSLLDNLLGNAWKFTRHRPLAHIELGREEVDGEACLFVRDNGAGFDMAQAGRLFAPFRRLHSQEQFEGTGVGLATVAGIVRRHGGRVWAEGQENAGATIRFTLAGAPLG